MIRRSAQRVAVFIDAANMYHSAKNIYGARVNFKQVVADAVGDRALIRAIAYVITTKTGEEKAFLEALETNGIEIKSKELQEFSNGNKKGDWDVGISVDAIRMSDNVDVVILMSGDGDFIPLVEYLQNRGKQVEVVGFRSSASSKLAEACDGFVDLSEAPVRALIRQGRPVRSSGRTTRTPRAAAQASTKNDNVVKILYKNGREEVL